MTVAGEPRLDAVSSSPCTESSTLGATMLECAPTITAIAPGAAESWLLPQPAHSSRPRAREPLIKPFLAPGEAGKRTVIVLTFSPQEFLSTSSTPSQRASQ
jgi:hypothetical protein